MCSLVMSLTDKVINNGSRLTVVYLTQQLVFRCGIASLKPMGTQAMHCSYPVQHIYIIIMEMQKANDPVMS